MRSHTERRRERARQAAERLRREIDEHANGPSCGASDCLFHGPRDTPTDDAQGGRADG